ncbi:MAG: multinuclear nonheme iron-dependent oxidase [Methyloceanibacter sp.]
MPYTEEVLNHVVDRVSQVQDILDRRLTLESVSSYVTFGCSEMTEWQFVSEVANRADCWLLFDVNKVPSFVPPATFGLG